MSNTWAFEDSVKTECKISHCFSENMFKWYYFGYVGLIKMYIKINFIFFNVAMKHLGLIDVARISISATQTLRWGPPNLSTPSPILTPPLVGSLKNSQGLKYLCINDSHVFTSGFLHVQIQTQPISTSSL